MRQPPHLWAVPFALIAPAAYTAQVYANDYLTVAQAQLELFPGAQQFVDVTVQLSESQLAEIKRAAGVRQRQARQPVWRVQNNGQLAGWFLVDDVIGKHEFITYATAISPEGKVMGVEILSYRETHGGQIRNPTWRQNFIGKSAADALKLGQDIPNISGATLSCRNVTDGVKRMLAIYQLVLASNSR